MKTQVECYNFHDLLTLEIRHQARRVLLPEIDQPYRYFQVADPGREADILLEVSDFTPANSGCTVVDHQYHVRENYFYCEDRWGSLKWKVEIQGFEEGRTQIRFHSTGGDIKHLLAPGLLPASLILKHILGLRLRQKGYRLIHSASAVKGGKACLFFGRGGSYKTTLMMDLMRHRQGWTFQGDDLVILGQGRVHSFPLFLGIFTYRLTHMEDEELNWLHRIGLLHYLWRDRRASMPISDTGRLHGIIHCSTRQDAGYTLEPEPLEQNLDSLSEISNMEDYFSPSLNIVGVFPRYVQAYSYVFPQNRLRAGAEGAAWQPPDPLLSRHLVLPLNPDKDMIGAITREIDQSWDGFMGYD